jgi:hypothetical protein
MASSTPPQSPPNAPRSVMNPLQDITNVDVSGSQHTPKSPPSSRSCDKQRDVILLQDDVEFVPDSFSPQLHCGDRRVVVEKVHVVDHLCK